MTTYNLAKTQTHKAEEPPTNYSLSLSCPSKPPIHTSSHAFNFIYKSRCNFQRHPLPKPSCYCPQVRSSHLAPHFPQLPHSCPQSLRPPQRLSTRAFPYLYSRCTYEMARGATTKPDSAATSNTSLTVYFQQDLPADLLSLLSWLYAALALCHASLLSSCDRTISTSP